MPKEHLVSFLFSHFLSTCRALIGKRHKQVKGHHLGSGLASHVYNEEKLARFLKQRKHFAEMKGIVKYPAFLPSRHDGNTSAFRHTGEPANELWQIGRTNLGSVVKVYGAGILAASDVRQAGLDVSASEPPPRHANIEGWPTLDDPVLTKAARMEVAKLIAKRAVLLLCHQ